MKFNNLYTLLLEDAIDKRVEKGLKFDRSGKLEYLKTIYKYMSDKVKRHNKFHLFLDFIVKEIQDDKWGGFSQYYTLSPEEIYQSEIIKNNIVALEEYFTDCVHYDINIKNMKTFEQMGDEITKRKVKVIDGKGNIKIDQNLAKVIKETDEYVIIRPWNFEGSKTYGSELWCICQREKYWDYYILGEGKMPYFILFKGSKKVEWRNMNWKITCVQIDLYGEYWITNTGNEVDLGLTGNDAKQFFDNFKIKKDIRLFDHSIDIEKFCEKDDNMLFKVCKNLGQKSDQYSGAESYTKLLESFRQLLISSCSKEQHEKYEQFLYSAKLKEKWFTEYQKFNIIGEMLEDPKFDVNIKDGRGDTLLMRCCLRLAGDDYFAKIAKMLIANKRIDVNIIEQYGQTVLITCLGYHTPCKNSLDITKVLIAREDTDINYVTPYGVTALLRAYRYDLYDIAELLLARKDIEVSEGIIDLAKDDLRGGEKRLYNLLVKYGYIKE